MASHPDTLVDMTNVPEGPIFFFLFDVIPALFVSLVAAGLTAAIDREKTRKSKIVIAAVLAVISLVVISFPPARETPLCIIAGLVGMLWFPLAVALAIFLSRTRFPYGNHILALVTTFIVYIAETGLFYLGRLAGLRDAMVWIYPPVPMTYELMLLPVWFHATVQFFLTLVLALIVLLVISRIPRECIK